MRQTLLRKGANELSYEIRAIVKKAEQLEALGHTIYWENIGDPIQKHNTIPLWMKEALSQLMMEDETYGYSHSKGDLYARSFLADMTNQRGGAQITANDITFFNGLGDAIAKVYQYLLPSARVIGPSPAYSTHSSAEAAHADHKPITYQLDPDNSWYPDVEYTFILYSKNPDNSCVLLMKLHKDDHKKYIKTPNITIGSTDKGELLKQYHLKIDKPEIPYVYKTAYVLKKEHTYYFHWKNNKNLRLKVFDANKNEIELKTTNNTPTLDCTETGLYYFTVYQKEPLNQSATLSLYKAE
jgi:hypothetical protein